MLQRARAGSCRRRRGVLGGTFHSVAHRLVRRHAAALGLPAGFGVLDAGDAADVLDLLREEHGHAQAQARASRRRARCSTSTRARSTRRSRCRAWSRSTSRGARSTARRSRALFKAYTARKRALGVLDLDDLLLYWRALAARRGDRAADGGGVRPRADRRVPGRQRAAGRHRRARSARTAPTVTAVGDDFQAIYGFRSASAAHILDFPAHFPGTRGGHAGAQLPLHAAGARRRERGRGAGARARSRSVCARTATGGARPRVVCVRDEAAQAEEVCDARARGARAGHGAARAGGADAHVARLRPARARAHPPAHPVRASTAGCATSRPRT